MIGSWARRLHPWLSGLFALGVLLQAFLAGAALTELGGSGDFATHRDVGYTIGIVQLIALVLAFPAQMSARDKGISAGLLVLYIVQTILPGFKSGVPFIAELHPLNAMVLFTLSIWYARHAWQVAGGAPDAPAKGG